MTPGRSARLLVGLLVTATASVGSACATSAASTRPEPFPATPQPSAFATSAMGPAATGYAPAEVDAVLQVALSLRGTKYRLGSQDPKRGLDCSGLVRYVFSQQQLELPRTVNEQFGAGRPVDFDRIQAGDVLFFATTPAGLETGTATHVGIALGPVRLGEFVHAPGSGGSVRVDRFDAPYWRARWVGARRMF
jgi:cell wall-associated NlpC family hydrolase